MPYLAGLIIIFCLHLVAKLINIVITTFKSLRESDGKKLEHLMKSMEDNTRAVYVLNESMKSLNQRIVDSDVSAVKTEMNLTRLIATVRELAGERWTDIQKKIRADEFIE